MIRLIKINLKEIINVCIAWFFIIFVYSIVRIMLNLNLYKYKIFENKDYIYKIKLFGGLMIPFIALVACAYFVGKEMIASKIMRGYSRFNIFISYIVTISIIVILASVIGPTLFFSIIHMFFKAKLEFSCIDIFIYYFYFSGKAILINAVIISILFGGKEAINNKKIEYVSIGLIIMVVAFRDFINAMPSSVVHIIMAVIIIFTKTIRLKDNDYD